VLVACWCRPIYSAHALNCLEDKAERAAGGTAVHHKRACHEELFEIFMSKVNAPATKLEDLYRYGRH
jgi:hypothetical protein